MLYKDVEFLSRTLKLVRTNAKVGLAILDEGRDPRACDARHKHGARWFQTPLALAYPTANHGFGATIAAV